ncbi:MAG: helix-turn-helix domain-containing protein [Kouleothrix sp.]|nr:helix-turn-helix domain-containing protein [Kouleothrix sp.]
MNELGERLREARESQGISLPQAAVETRILQRYLVALEDGDFHHLPGDVYARGFIRNYANYLSLPAEELIELYRRDRGMSEPIRVVPATSSPRIRGMAIPSFFGVFFVVLVLVGASYLLLSALNYVGESSQNQVASAPTSAPTPLPLATATPGSAAPIVAVAPTAASIETLGPAGAATSPTSVPTPQIDAPIVAEVSIDNGDNRGSWLQIKVDGQTVFQKVLGSGQSLPAYRAQRDVWIRAGNASVVSVVINGQKQCCTANPGEVVTFIWPPR